MYVFKQFTWVLQNLNLKCKNRTLAFNKNAWYILYIGEDSGIRGYSDMKTADSFAKHEKLLHPLDIDAHWLQEPTNFYSNSNNTKDYKTTLLRVSLFQIVCL